MMALRNRSAGLTCVAAACCLALASCGTTTSAPSIGATTGASTSTATQEQSFEFGGMTFTLPGHVVRQSATACGSSGPLVAAGTTAVVEFPSATEPNCPAETYAPIPSGLAKSLLGVVSLRSGVSGSFGWIAESKAGGLRLPLLPAGSFEATLGPELVPRIKGYGPTIIVWNSKTHSLIEISGPRSTELAADVVANLHSD